MLITLVRRLNIFLYHKRNEFKNHTKIDKCENMPQIREPFHSAIVVQTNNIP